MPLPSPQEASDAAQQARAKARQLAESFLTVFGRPSKRTVDQRVVVAHLAVCAGDDGNSYRFNEAKDGLALVAAGIHRDGARSILRVIERQVELAANADKPAKPKVQSRR